MNKIIRKAIGVILLSIMIFISTDRIYAAGASISVSSNKSQVIVGDTVTVTVRISSSQALGSWKWTPDYNTSKFKLISGDTSVADFGDGKIKAKSYTYKFKAIATGSSTITVKGVDVYNWSEKNLSVSKGSKTIKIITHSDYVASLSKNNNLSALSVNGLTLNPSFNKNTTSYKVNATANTTSVKISAKAEDSRSDVDGTGTFKVSEGDNKFVITVTAQNGSTKKYTIIISVVDPNPIKVTIDDKEYVIVKRESNLEAPDNYEKKEITINNQKIPAFYNETNKYTLVGLKDEEGDTSLFIYDELMNKYTKYTEVELDKIKLMPLKMDLLIRDYTKSTVTIDETEFEALRRANSDYAIIHATNIENGVTDYYTYDTKTNSLVRYTDEEIKPFIATINKYKKLVTILIVETIFIILVLIGILIDKVHKNKIRKEKIEEYRRKKEEYRKQKAEKELSKKKTKKEK